MGNVRKKHNHYLTVDRTNSLFFRSTNFRRD